MSRQKALLLVGGVLALAIIAYLVSREPSNDTPARLKIPGYATAAQLKANASRSVMDTPEPIAYPIDELEITAAAGNVHLKRVDEGGKVAWRLVHPIDAPAVKYQVEKMIKLFMSDTSSIYAKRITAEDLPLFDLEPSRRVRVVARASGEVWRHVNLVIGKVTRSELETAESGVSHDTWLLRGDDEAVVHRVAGKDLRAPFLVAVEDLRDKRLFALDPSDLVTAVISAPDGTEVALSGTRVETPDGAGGDGPSWKVDWRLAGTSTLELDKSASSLVRAFTNLRAQAFVDASEVPGEGLGERVWRVQVSTHDGKEHAVTLSEADEDKVWAQVQGRQELFTLSRHSAESLRKRLGDLQDKRIFTIAPSDVSRLRFSPEGESPFMVSRRNNHWMLKGGRRAELRNQVTGILEARAKRWAHPSEGKEAKAALGNPLLTAIIATADGDTRLVVGDTVKGSDQKGDRWAERIDPGGHESAAFIVQAHVVQRFRKTKGELAWKKLFDFSEADIVELTLSPPGGDQPVRVVRAADGTMEVPDLAVGESTHTAAISTLLNSLASLRAMDFAKPENAKSAMAGSDGYTLEITLEKGIHIRLDISGPDPDNQRWATVNGGPLRGRVFSLNNHATTTVMKVRADLIQ